KEAELMRESLTAQGAAVVHDPPWTVSVLPTMVRPTAPPGVALPGSRLYETMVLVSLPKKMPNDWVAALAVYSATMVGIDEVRPGVADWKRPGSRALVARTGPPGPNRPSEMLCSDGSPLTPNTVGVVGLSTSGTAKAPRLVLRPKAATIIFNFIAVLLGG